MAFHSEMTSCEQKRRFLRNGKKLLDWVVVEVSQISVEDDREIRCMHCRGRVRIHRRHVAHGPRDHVEHRRRKDSEACRGGCYFKGVHRISSEPVA